MENTDVSNIDLPIPYRMLSSADDIPISRNPEENQDDEKMELFLEFPENNGPKDVLRPGAIVYQTIYARAIRGKDRIYITVSQ